MTRSNFFLTFLAALGLYKFPPKIPVFNCFTTLNYPHVVKTGDKIWILFEDSGIRFDAPVNGTIEAVRYRTTTSVNPNLQVRIETVEKS